MTVLVVTHRVADVDAWKPYFDGHEAVRRRHGATGHRVYNSAVDPGDLTVEMIFPDRTSAEAFLGDPSLKETMAASGVTTEPIASFRETVEEKSY